MLPLDPNKVIALTKSMMAWGWVYGLGAKVVPLSSQAADLPVAQRKVDCSGFVRWNLFHALGQPEEFGMPDGSVNQHFEWADRNFKKVPQGQLGRNDDCVYMFFLDPQDTTEGIGHTGLCINGWTCESHGSHGPDRRLWGSQSWMEECSAYILSTPDSRPPQAA